MGAIFDSILRRSRATTRLEKAAGGDAQATWAIEALAGYFERGGTMGGLLFQIGESGDEELEQLLGEDPGLAAGDVPGFCGTPDQPPAVAGGFNLAPRFLDRPEVLDEAKVYQVTSYGDVLLDDGGEVEAYFDRTLPAYLVRVSDVTVEPGERQTQQHLRAVVVERASVNE